MAKKKKTEPEDSTRQEADRRTPKKQKQPAKGSLNNTREGKLYKDSHSKKHKPETSKPEKSGDYNFDYGTERGSKQYEILRTVLSDYDGKHHTGYAAKYIKALDEAGLTYRKQDMQADMRRALSVEHSKSPEAAERAHNWVTNFYEPARKYLRSQGLASDPKSVNLYIQLWKKGSRKVNRAADKQLTDFYNSMDISGDTP
jgi:hypothetical protein